MKNNFVKQEYHLSLINEHLEKISLFNRSGLITEKDTRQKSDRIPFLIAYNRFLPNITKTIRGNWNILQIKEIFKNEPIRAFKQNKSIHKHCWDTSDRKSKSQERFKDFKRR